MLTLASRYVDEGRDFDTLEGAARRAGGWRFDKDDGWTDARKQLWLVTREDLDEQIDQAREKKRNSTGARLGRAVRRLGKAGR